MERKQFLQALTDYAGEASTGSGRFVLLAGEAGVGKTALLEAFRGLHQELRWWWGACDAHSTHGRSVRCTRSRALLATRVTR